MAIKINYYGIKRFLLICALLTICFYIISNYNELKSLKLNINYAKLFISFIFLFIACLIIPFIWYRITKELRCNLPLKSTLKIRLISEIGKYIPGRVFGYGYLIIHYKEAGKDESRVFAGSLLELFLATFSSFLFFTIIQLFVSFKDIDNYKFFFILFSGIGLLILHPYFFQKLSDLFCKLVKKEKMAFRLSYLRILFLLFCFILFWIIFSLGFFTLMNAFSDIKFYDFFFISGSFAISTCAGFIAFFLPAGLGAREGALIYFLSIISGNVTATVVSISSRIWIIIGDLILFLAAIILPHHPKKES